MDEYLLLGLDELRVALPLPVVERVFHAVYVTPLPDVPDLVLGVVNVQGRVIPVVSLRRRVRLPDRPIALTDRLVIAHTARRSLALLADSASEVREIPESLLVAAEDVLPGLEYVAGVARLDDGLLLIQDLNRFLSLDEESVLDLALSAAPEP